MRKGKILLLTGLIVLTASSWSQLHLEDFESISVGDDISAGGWTNFFSKPILCADLNSNNVAAFYQGSQSDWLYGWDDAGSAADLGLGFDFYIADNSADPAISLALRANPGTVQMYFCTINPCRTNPYICIYFDSSGTFTELWHTTLTDPLAVETWHTLKVFISGSSNLVFEVSLNDDDIGTHTETTYVLSSGGMGIHADGFTSTDEIYVDNIKHFDIASSIESASPGHIKSVFR